MVFLVVDLGLVRERFIHFQNSKGPHTGKQPYMHLFLKHEMTLGPGAGNQSFSLAGDRVTEELEHSRVRG